jgi:hypothetical protein
VQFNAILAAYDKAIANNTPFTPPSGNMIKIEGSDVGVQVGVSPSVEAAVLAELDKLGFQENAGLSTSTTLVGMLPIADLMDAAQAQGAGGITPEYNDPLLFGSL